MAVLLLGLMVCTAILPSALGRSGPLPHKHSSLSTQNKWNITCTSDYSCLDCWTVQVCAPTPDGQSLYEIDRLACDRSSRPYCNYTTATCSSELDPTCYNSNVTASNFTCMRDGYYPDPYNCSVYYHCQHEVASQYSCYPPFPFYDIETEDCVSYNYYCANVSTSNCKYYSGMKLILWYSPSLFAYCGFNGTVITVDRCIGAYIFDQSTQMCVPHCPHAGLFPKDDDCANYYKCSPKTHGPYSDFLITDMTCPAGQAFSETEYSCVDRSLVPNCQVPYSALFNK